jgi:hypothetical protein
MRALFWAGLMLVWMGGLISGFWWVWPHIQRLTLTADLVVGVMWLVIGGAAWLVALNVGLQRYWPPRLRPGAPGARDR